MSTHIKLDLISRTQSHRCEIIKIPQLARIFYGNIATELKFRYDAIQPRHASVNNQGIIPLKLRIIRGHFWFGSLADEDFDRAFDGDQ